MEWRGRGVAEEGAVDTARLWERPVILKMEDSSRLQASLFNCKIPPIMVS